MKKRNDFEQTAFEDVMTILGCVLLAGGLGLILLGIFQ
jgi:hypothetical protein